MHPLYIKAISFRYDEQLMSVEQYEDMGIDPPMQGKACILNVFSITSAEAAEQEGYSEVTIDGKLFLIDIPVEKLEQLLSNMNAIYDIDRLLAISEKLRE